MLDHIDKAQQTYLPDGLLPEPYNAMVDSAFDRNGENGSVTGFSYCVWISNPNWEDNVLQIFPDGSHMWVNSPEPDAEAALEAGKIAIKAALDIAA